MIPEEDELYFEDYERLLSLITGGVEIKGRTYYLKNEIELFFGEGNKEAGKRVRWIMQQIRFCAKDTRDNVQEFKRDML